MGDLYHQITIYIFAKSEKILLFFFLDSLRSYFYISIKRYNCDTEKEKPLTCAAGGRDNEKIHKSNESPV